MFAWLRRIIRGLFGAFFERIEDPELTLKQLKRDIPRKLPRMRQAVATANANRILAESELKEARLKLEQLEMDIVEAVKGGEVTRKAAEMLIAQKNILEASIPDKERQVELSTAASKQAREMLDDYEQEVDRQIALINQQIAKNRQATALEETAKIKAAFEVDDETGVLEEISRRVDERHARAQGMLEVAQGSADAQLMAARRASAKARVSTQYEEYRRQLGLAGEVETPKVMQPITPETESGAQSAGPGTVETKGGAG
jgi:phage shock protein A